MCNDNSENMLFMLNSQFVGKVLLLVISKCVMYDLDIIKYVFIKSFENV